MEGLKIRGVILSNESVMPKNCPAICNLNDNSEGYTGVRDEITEKKTKR